MYPNSKYHKQLFDEPEVLRTIQGMIEFRIKVLRELYDNESYVKFLEDGGYFRIYTDLIKAYE